MNVIIRPGKFEEVRPLTNAAKKDRVTMENPEGAVWFVAEEEGVIVGCVCAVIRGPWARFKSDFMLPKYRRKKLYQAMFGARMAHTLKFPVKRLTAFCTPMSLDLYLKHGFEKISARRDIWFVKRDLQPGASS